MKLEECKRGYHKYEQIENNKDAIIEICQICGKKNVTKVFENGKINNKEYLENHKRSFLQRGDKDYEMIYGKNNYFVKKPKYTDEELLALEKEKWHKK